MQYTLKVTRYLRFVKNNKYLLIIIILGAALRLYRLNEVPIALFGDEIDVGLHAKSILTTGKDYLGNSYPAFFQSFAEYRLPVQLYVAVPFVKIFGLNAWGVRLPSVLFGVIAIITFYLLVKELFDRKITLIATLFLSISPWHLQFSRQSNDSTFLLPFIFLATWLFIKGLKNYKMLVLSSVVFALSFYSYAISAVFVPLFVLALLLIYRINVLRFGIRKLVFVAVISLFFLLPFINAMLGNAATHRISYLSVSKNDQEVTANNGNVGGNVSLTLLAGFLDNPIADSLINISKNYLDAFSLNFLFSHGDPNPRHSIYDFAGMYIFDFVMIVVGIVVWLRLISGAVVKNRKSYLLFIVWLLLAPIPSALTKDGASHAARLILIFPALILFSAVGFSALLSNSRRLSKILVIFFTFFMLATITRYLYAYYVIWPRDSWRFWHYGFEETIKFVKEIDRDYEKIYFNNTYEPMLPRFLFWYDYDMETFQKQFSGDQHIEEIKPGFDGFVLGEKYYFGDIKKPVENLTKKGRLIVASAEKDISNPLIFDKPELRLLNTFYSPDDLPIFYVFTGNVE